MLRRTNCCAAQGGPAMATIVRSRRALGHTRLNPVAVLRFILDRAVTHWHARRRRTQELRELYAFDERELRDLGLSRSDFMSIENGTYHRE
jgi:uncharacterized protein YjiS (DUF1127 family)